MPVSARDELDRDVRRAALDDGRAVRLEEERGRRRAPAAPVLVDVFELFTAKQSHRNFTNAVVAHTPLIDRTRTRLRGFGITQTHTDR